MQHDDSQYRSIGLIADSCCDLTEDMKKRIGVMSVPLIIRIIGGHEFIDDGSVSIPNLIKEMRESPKGVQTACPSVDVYASCMRAFDCCFVITISSKLSGSYNAACLAAKMVKEESFGKKIHVFDSHSASAGETLLLLYLHKRINERVPFADIVIKAEEFLKNTTTLFVLKDMSNLIKNGRMPKIPGKLASSLNMRPIMGDNGNGEIKLIAMARGAKQSLSHLIETIARMTEDAAAQSLELVLGHCNAPDTAAELKERLTQRCEAVREVIIVPTGALSTVYAGDGGIIVAF